MNKSFYLGGSRNKVPEYLTEFTDYDFSCADTWENKLLLDELGFDFYNIQNWQYKDNTIQKFAKHNQYPEVTIIMRENFEAYKQAFDGINSSFYMAYMWKSSPIRTTKWSDLDRDNTKNVINAMVNLITRKEAAP